MNPKLRWRFVLLAIAVCALCTVGRAQGQSWRTPITTPAVREGWWIRINPTNQADHVYWRFGATAATVGAPVAWAKGESPAEVDAPAEQRVLDRVHVALLGMPPAASVSLCLFFRDRGVAMIEFTQERNVEVDQSQHAPECLP